MAVLDPVKLVITNWGELMGGDGVLDDCSAPVHPHHPEMGKREFKLGREVWIERTDYEEVPPKGFFRLFPGNKVRLKYGHVIECTGATKDADGKLVEVQATLVADTKSGTPGAGRDQGEGQHHLGGRRRRGAGRGTVVRAPVRRSAARAAASCWTN